MFNYVGQRLGNYQIIQLLGSGGFADVYLAEHVNLHTRVAIKVMRATLGQRNLQSSFLAEARLIAQLTHPNIVRVFDFDLKENVPFLVMDYAANGTLRQRHQNGLHVAYKNIVPYVKQVAAALQYAHDRKIIHRDVKPENMLMGSNKEILLSDFGIAVVSQSSRYANSIDVGGTIAYMAPEQLNGSVSPASDQYALGVVTYEWLCGERPFQGTFHEIGFHHVHTSPLVLHEKAPDIPREISLVVHKALSKDPQQRFHNVQAFAVALEQAIQKAAKPRQTVTLSPSSAPQGPGNDKKGSTPAAKPSPSILITPMPFRPTETIVAIPANLKAKGLTPASPIVAPLLTNMKPKGPNAASPIITPPPAMKPNPKTSRPVPAPIIATPPTNGPNLKPKGTIPVSSPTISPNPKPKMPAPVSPLATSSPVTTGTNRKKNKKKKKSGQGQQPPLQQTRRSSVGTTQRWKNIGLVVAAILILGLVFLTWQPVKKFIVSSTTSIHLHPVRAGTLLYQANWTQGNDQWAGSSEWSAPRNGQFGSNGTSTNNFISWPTTQLPSLNYRVEATIRYVRSTYTSDSSHSYEFGIVVRGDGGGNGYEIGVEHTNNTSVNGQTSTLISIINSDNTGFFNSTGGFSSSNTILKQNTAFHLQPDTWHTYKVEVSGNDIKYYLDGLLQFETSDNTYITSGTRVGLRAVYADIDVKDFKVTAL